MRDAPRSVRTALTVSSTISPVVVATDSRHYAGLSPNLFRFQPLRLAAADLPRMHGIDERIALSTYVAAIEAYRQIVLETTAR